jgi:hypothetical protein
MKKKKYFLNFFVIILITSFSTKIKAQSFDIYVLDKNAGTTETGYKYCQCWRVMPAGQTMEKKLRMIW